ncbi:MAG: N2,N2-dimethylguanosine tRNA methyltransferase [Desulfurococcaceae archaeon]
MNITIGDHEEIINEGLAKIIIPKLEEYRRPDGVIEPAWMPVFYNPEAVVSRDYTTLLLRSIMGEKEFYFVDALAGSGVRGVRIAIESNGKGILNDVDPRAYSYIKKNILVNNLTENLEAYNHEANTLLNNLVYAGLFIDYVDIDPYGSPIPFIDSALKIFGKTGYLGVTATDTGPLTCTYRHKALTRYWSDCIKVDFEKESAARLLIASITRRAAALELEAIPLLTLVYRHYIRVFFKVNKSSSRAHRLVKDCIGYIWYCEKTLERGFIKELGEVKELKCKDGSSPVIMGKTWICNLYSSELITKITQVLEKSTWISIKTRKINSIITEEHAINHPYIRLDKICAVNRFNMPRINDLLKRLIEKGVKCSRTHMDSRGIKAVCDHSMLIETIREIVSK